MGNAILNLPLDQLSDHINQCQNLDDHLKDIQEKIDDLSIYQKELIKSPPFYLMPLILIGETLIQLGRHNPSSKLVHTGNSLITAGFVGNRSDYEIYQKQEDQIIHLNSEYRKKFSELEIQGNAIKETLGVKVKKIVTDEVVEDEDIKNLWYNDSKEAEEIAKTWIREAEKMINTTESEIVRSAKVYLAMKILMKK